MNDKLKLILGIFLIVFVGLTACQMIGCVWGSLWGGNIWEQIAQLPYLANLLTSAVLSVVLYFIIVGKGKK